MSENSTTFAPETRPTTALYTGPTADDLARIPAELHALPQWVLWRGIDKIDKHTGEIIGLDKVPIDAQTLRNASVSDPATWNTFAYCTAALATALEEWEHGNPAAYRGGGIGFVFTEQDDFFGLDTDKCRNPATGEIEPWALSHLQRLDTYTEVSQSRTGLHGIGKGKLPPGGRRKERVELYDAGRFFVVTGWHLEGLPVIIEPRQDALNALHADIFGSPQPSQSPSKMQTSSPLMDDAKLLARARKAQNKHKFTQLWNADSATLAYLSQSEADMALCTMLAFWTPDAGQIDRLFRQSKLWRDKWDEQHGAQTYGQLTIEKALTLQTEHYGSRQRDRATLVVPSSVSTTDTLPYSDYTNALAFVHDHGEKLRYCHPWGKWLVWTGTYWDMEKNTGAVMRYAKDTIKRLAAQMLHLDDKEVTELLRHIKSSLSTMKLKAMIESAESELPLPVLPDALDRDRWLLNVANGTLDLRTGTLQPHLRDDMLTRCLDVVYDPQATCPTWDTFLWRIMGGTDAGSDSADDSALALENREAADARARRLIAFLQRAVGYALTGMIREHVLLILWGSGRNGKSTFLNTLRMLLGPYAIKAAAELLMVSNSDRHPTERTDLFQKRFVAVIETEQGRRMAEVFVKEATGGDPIRARRMREDMWEFQPTHKLFLATNHKPTIKGTDAAIWERMKLIPFTVTIPADERDTTLPDKLQAELPGILAWAVRGCLAWQQDGLGEPDEVTKATGDYRAEMDVLGAFITETCVVEKDKKVKASLLYERYKAWCARTGEDAIIQRNFGASLTERGFTRVKEGTGWFWHGIGVYAEDN